MSAQRYTVSLSPRSLDVLDVASRVPWTRIELAQPVRRLDHLRVRTHLVRICGDAGLVISPVATDVIPKLEVFHLRVQQDEPARPDPRFQPLQYQDSGELLSAFLGVAHQVLVGTRRHLVPEWARHAVQELIVEDLLVVRHSSGQQAFIAPDDNEPGTLAVTRMREHVPLSEAEIVSLRIL